MCNCIQEAKKMIEELESPWRGRAIHNFLQCSTLEVLVDNLELLQQKPSLEELLEEMCPIIRSFSLTYNYFSWYIEGYDISGLVYRSIGKTPREALLALKEKLAQPSKFTISRKP